MAESDRDRWNEKHARNRGAREPNPRLLEALREGGGPGRSALDLACGTGRHALALARAGYEVLAVDVSDVALEGLAAAAAEAGLAVRTERRDLAGGEFPAGTFDLVVVVSFLERRLWPALRAAVRPGGRIFFETFTAAHAEATGMRRDWCLESGELLAAFEGFEVLAHRRDSFEGRARECLLARRPERPA